MALITLFIQLQNVPRAPGQHPFCRSFTKPSRTLALCLRHQLSAGTNSSRHWQTATFAHSRLPAPSALFYYFETSAAGAGLLRRRAEEWRNLAILHRLAVGGQQKSKKCQCLEHGGSSKVALYEHMIPCTFWHRTSCSTDLDRGGFGGLRQPANHSQQPPSAFSAPRRVQAFPLSPSFP